MIYEKNPSLLGREISLPVVTNALTHGISMAGYLFLDEGDEVIVSDLFWGNYNLTLNHAFGANLVKFNLFKNGGFDLDAFEARLSQGGPGKKTMILNFPNLAMLTISSCSFLPSAPVSPKPEVMTTAPLTPFSTQSLVTCGTNWPGTTRMARSTFSGTSLTVG